MTLCSKANYVERSGIKRKLSEIPGYKWMPLFWLTLFLNYTCTRRCPDCTTAMQGHTKGEMSDKIFEDMLKYIVKTYNQSDIAIFFIIFLGGEPLLRTDRIKRVMDKLAEENVIGAGNVFSNCDLVDRVNWDDLKSIGVWSHNVTDVSVEETQRRMEIVRAHLNIQSYTMMVVADDFNMQGSRIEDITRMGLENKAWVRLYHDKYKHSDEAYKKELVKKIHKFYDVYEEAMAKGELNWGLHGKMDMVHNILSPRHWDNYNILTPYGCGRRVMAIHPDGNVSACIREMNEFCSNIYSETPIEDIKQDKYLWAYKRPNVAEECKTCEVREPCQGGCPNERYQAYGVYSGKTPWCEVYKETLPRLMKMVNGDK